MEKPSFKQRVYYCCSKYGVTKEFEDILQDIRLLRLEGKGQHQTVEQAVIDQIRSRFARNGMWKKLMASYQRNPDWDIKQANISIPPDDPTFGIDLIKILSIVKDRSHAAMVYLHHIVGVEQEDIAKAFGLSHSRVSQIIKSTIISLRKKIIK